MSPRKVVLVIDDESVSRMALSMICQNSGYAVRVAAEGREGLSLFECNSVDVVLLDYHLPGPDYCDKSRSC